MMWQTAQSATQLFGRPMRVETATFNETRNVGDDAYKTLFQMRCSSKRHSQQQGDYFLVARNNKCALLAGRGSEKNRRDGFGTNQSLLK
jgi:hypothetical protein